ncbi:MAG TPA: cyclic nucleotide-binding domain-containing protein [Burkholderiales bacterium]|jgi:CRP-like cAMP-binding protein|nr:cyclic nucleotide-binding domain-containing protein [Burkholderiales bacterium]
MSAALNTISLFQGLAEADLRELSERASTRSLPGDALVVREGEPADALYGIVRGRVKVYLGGEGGGEVILDTKGPGQYFGEMMLDDKPRSASVMTLEPSELAVIPRVEFKAFLLKHPEIALHVIRNLIRIARGQNVRTREDVRSREQLRQYIAQLDATQAQDLPNVKRWVSVKRWTLGALLVLAFLMYYFADVFLEILRTPGVSTFVSS